MKDQIIQLMQALGFVQIESKNLYMISFYKEEDQDPRINIYFTKMTVSTQWKNGNYKYHYNVSLSELEEIVNNI